MMEWQVQSAGITTVLQEDHIHTQKTLPQHQAAKEPVHHDNAYAV